jgi:hypothetical protein
MDFVPPFLKKLDVSEWGLTPGVHNCLIPVTLDREWDRILRVLDTLSEPRQKLDRGQENWKVSLRSFHTLTNLSN